jgi:hypothetical protein
MHAYLSFVELRIAVRADADEGRRHFLFHKLPQALNTMYIHVHVYMYKYIREQKDRRNSTIHTHIYTHTYIHIYLDGALLLAEHGETLPLVRLAHAVKARQYLRRHNANTHTTKKYI